MHYDHTQSEAVVLLDLFRRHAEKKSMRWCSPLQQILVQWRRDESNQISMWTTETHDNTTCKSMWSSTIQLQK